MQFLKAIKNVRKARGLTQAGLADLAGIGQSKVSKIEAGQGNPSAETLYALAAALDAEIVFVPRRVTGAVNTILDAHFHRQSKQYHEVQSVRDELFIPDDIDG
jgi:transcriptional regulator with XRE-family HTH domain